MQKLKLLLSALFIVLLASCASTGGGTAAPAAQGIPIAERNGTLVVLHTNDHHGHPLPFYDFPSDGEGGLPARLAYVKGIRAQFDDVLVLDAGDINTGRPESMFFDAEPDILGYNAIAYDAVTLGNHEFDKPFSVLQKQMSLAKFPFLSANVKHADGSWVAKPYVVKKFPRFSVGVFGLTTTEINTIAGGVDSIKGLVIEDEVKAAREMVDVLRNKEKVDVVIALVHLGNYSTNTAGSRRVAAQVPGIDLIVDGHTHMEDILASGHWDMKAPLVENGVPIVQTQQWGLKVGKAMLTIEQGKVTSLSWELVPINQKKMVDGKPVFITSEIPQDPDLLALLTPYAKKVDEVLAERIGEAAAAFPVEDVRKAETAVGDLVADALLWKTKSMGADFALVNSGGIRAAIPKGELKKLDVYSCVPYDNSVFVLSLKGTEVIALFDFIATVKQGKGAFPQVSEGVSFTYDPVAGRVGDLLIGGGPVDPDRTYRITTNSFVAGGGDGYVVMKRSTQRYDTSLFQRDVLIEYIKSRSVPIEPKLFDRIRVVSPASMLPVFDDAA